MVDAILMRIVNPRQILDQFNGIIVYLVITIHHSSGVA